MTKIEVITPTSSAANPNHPDHPRWVKEQFKQRRADWLRSLGIAPNTRHEETVANDGMQRLEARKRNAKPVYAKTPEPERDPDKNAAQSMAAAAGYGYRKKHVGNVRELEAKDKKRLERRKKQGMRALARAGDFECGRCTKCRRCKREIRCQNILRFGRAGDERFVDLAKHILSFGIAASMKIGVFAGKSQLDVDRLLTKLLEDVCDKSVAVAGKWW
jgi:hypothetical protein